MKYIYIVLLTLLFVMFKPVIAQENLKLEVIYPKETNISTNTSSIFFIGHTNPNASLKINNKQVKVYKNGAFVEILKLDRGQNQINLVSSLDKIEKNLLYTVAVPDYDTTTPKFPLKFEHETIFPNNKILYKTGDVLHVSFKGSTGHKAYFSIGKQRKNIPMIEQPAKYIKTKPVYGKSTISSQIPIKGIYKGSYRIQAKDKFLKEPIVLKLVTNRKSITTKTGASLSTLFSYKFPIIAEITQNNAVIRVAPNKSRLTPLPVETTINITGQIGDMYRFKMNNSMNGWISKNDINILPEGSPLLENTVTLLNLKSDKTNVYLKIPLTQKTPFLIEQTSEQKINLKIFGTTADIDLYSYNKKDDFLKEIKWTQETNDTLNITLRTNARQFWGYKYYYEDDNLVLKLRKKPIIDLNKPLKNKIICLDPGHGGEEEGVLGPTGIAEKTVNLEIAQKLKTILEKKGATVVMTRTSDEEVSLRDRINIANAFDSQIILSLHNNSLPHGRNPYKEHGTSTYYYNSQSLPLAKSLHQSLLNDLKFKDFGLFWSSFYLTRPQEMLSVLLETGFMINPDEYILITDPKFQTKIAQSIAKGLESFFIRQEVSVKNN